MTDEQFLLKIDKCAGSIGPLNGKVRTRLRAIARGMDSLQTTEPEIQDEIHGKTHTERLSRGI